MKRLVFLFVLLTSCHKAPPQQHPIEYFQPKLTPKEQAEYDREVQEAMQRFYGELTKAGFSDYEINRIKDPKHSYRLNCALNPTLQQQKPTDEEWREKYAECMEQFSLSEQQAATDEWAQNYEREHPEILDSHPHKHRGHQNQ